MKPTRFDQMASAFAAGVSRRQVIVGLGGAMLAGITALGRSGGSSFAQADSTPTPADEPRPDFPPLYPLPEPFAFEDPFILDVLGTPVVASPTIEESLCLGTDDSQDVELYDGTLGVTREFVAAHQGAVGNLRWNHNLREHFDDPGNVNFENGEGLRYCSGTLIADNLFLTAGHCFAQRPVDSTIRVPRINGADDPISRPDIAANMHVGFNYQRGADLFMRPEQTFAVESLVEDRLGDLDYAIIQLAGKPGQQFGPARIGAVDAPIGSTIGIIGHPLGVPKRIEAGPASGYDGPEIYYNDIDTARGSSGAGILASPDGPLVGVHTNGGCFGVASGNNHGVTISALLEASPILRELAAT